MVVPFILGEFSSFGGCLVEGALAVKVFCQILPILASSFVFFDASG